MKLFVWENVLYGYAPGIIFAHAETLEEAKEAVLRRVHEDWEKKALLTHLRKKPKVYDGTFGYHLWGGG